MPERQRRRDLLNRFRTSGKSRSRTDDDASSVSVSSEPIATGRTHTLTHPPVSSPASSIDLSSSVAQSVKVASDHSIAAIDIPPSQYWDYAYDRLKSDQPELLEHYEQILSVQLGGFPDTGSSSGKDVISQDRDRRRSQMDRLLQGTLSKMEKHAGARGKMGTAINIVLSLKSAIDLSLNSVPIGALIWSGLCFALELLLNPLNEAKASQDGIADVIFRMKWYSNLAILVRQQDSRIDEKLAGLRSELAEKILKLYQTLLEYMVKTICVRNRHSASILARNLFKVNNWAGSLEDIDKNEKSVQAAMDMFGIRQGASYTGKLVDIKLSEKESEIKRACYVANMEAEAESLQQQKDTLLLECYQWVLETEQYKELMDWHLDNAKRILWINGDAGKGKTMLLMGIVQDLREQLKTHLDEPNLSYFFCRGTDNRLNTATSVLRGLIWMLICQKSSLIEHLKKDFEDAGREIFEGPRAFHTLKKVFSAMLQDKDFTRTYLIVDALDECKSDLPLLLDVVLETSTNAKVKWVLSSRNENSICERLGDLTPNSRVSLEVNASSVSRAIHAYIDKKVSELRNVHVRRFGNADKSRFREGELRGILERLSIELHDKANGTFLWVALVIKQLRKCEHANQLLSRLQCMPAGLPGIYTLMLKNVEEDQSDNFDVYKRMFLTMVTAFRPLNLSELEALAGIDSMAYPERVVRQCGLFVVKEDEHMVSFIHQSAKDYLVQDPAMLSSTPEKKATSHILSKIFPDGHSAGNGFIVSQSVKNMAALRRDIYELNDPGIQIEDVKTPIPDPLSSLRYSCTFWVDHLEKIEIGHEQVGLCDDGAIHSFLRLHFLHWLEALSLMQSSPVALVAVRKLVGLLSRHTPNLKPRFLRPFYRSPVSRTEILQLARDFHRFIMFNQILIQECPLQIYFSALVFAPRHSLTRKLFRHEEPSWITQAPTTGDSWDACIHTSYMGTLGFHGSLACNGVRAAGVIHIGSIIIFEADSGRQLKTLFSEQDITHVAISSDGSLVSASSKGTFQRWDSISGTCVHTSRHETELLEALALFPDGRIVYALYGESVVKIRDPRDELLSTFYGHSDRITSIALSPRGMVASGSCDQTVRIWNPELQSCAMTLEHSDMVSSVTYSFDGEILAVGLANGYIQTWSSKSGICLQALQGHSSEVYSVAFLSNKSLVSSSRGDHSIKIWEAGGMLLKTLQCHTSSIMFLAVSHNDQIISVGLEGDVKIWDPSGQTQVFDRHDRTYYYGCTSMSPSGQLISRSRDAIKVWNQDGTCIRTLENDDSWETHSVAFCHDGRIAAAASKNNLILVLNPSGDVPQHLTGHEDRIHRLAFFADGKLLSFSRDRTFKIWDCHGSCLTTLD
ncbi:WD40 repeat-like protein, partial [Aspergillus homomorphus CBS 101889]